MSWYYVLHGQRQGPVSQERFDQLVADGVVTDETLVCLDALAAWQPYGTVRKAAAVSDQGTEVCMVSGLRYPRNQMMQYQGRWISGEHRDAFFARLREGVSQPLVIDTAMPGPYGYGGFWRRAAAFVIDLAIWHVLAYLAGFGFTAFLGNEGGSSRTELLTYLAVDLAMTTLLHLAYEVFFIRIFDATPGKLALGLRVSRADGSKLSLGRIVGRNFAAGLNGLTLGIGYLMAAFNSQKRGLHDYLCDTRVIRTR